MPRTLKIILATTLALTALGVIVYLFMEWRVQRPLSTRIESATTGTDGSVIIHLRVQNTSSFPIQFYHVLLSNNQGDVSAVGGWNTRENLEITDIGQMGREPHRLEAGGEIAMSITLQWPVPMQTPPPLTELDTIFCMCEWEPATQRHYRTIGRWLEKHLPASLSKHVPNLEMRRMHGEEIPLAGEPGTLSARNRDSR